MAVESGARASNTLTGELRSRPIAVLLAGAAERGTSGTFTFTHGARRDMVTLRLGKIAVVRTSDPIAYLGGILYELGAIDSATLNETLYEVASGKLLHGRILVERGAITRERLDEGLAEQTFRKVHHLFSLPEDAKWMFREDVDELAGARDDDRPAIDTWQAIWRGLRDQPAVAHVARTLAKIEGGVHLKDLLAVERFALAPEEIALCERLHAQPQTITQLVSSSPLIADRTKMLIYVLALARCVVRVETAPPSPVELGVEGVRDRARRIDEEEPHAMLGLRSGASIEAIRAAYFRLARLWHPEKIPEALAEVRAECQHVFLRLGEAHRTLTDVSARFSVDSLVGPEAVAANDSVTPPAPLVTLRDVDAALARKDLASAEAMARTLTSAGATGPDARAVIAWCTIGAGAITEPHALEPALAALDRILTGDPDCVRALFYRGQVLNRLGRNELALRDYRKAVRLDPRHVDAQREMRIHDMRLRTRSSGKLNAVTPRKKRPSREMAAPLTPDGMPSASDATFAPEPARAEDTSVRSGLRRLLARVAGK
jgi:hypothetical protein